MATLIDVRNIKYGDRIKTDFTDDEKNIVRKVIKVFSGTNSQNGIMISVDGGEPCPHCGRAGHPISDIDIGWVKWFEPKED